MNIAYYCTLFWSCLLLLKPKYYLFYYSHVGPVTPNTTYFHLVLSFLPNIVLWSLLPLLLLLYYNNLLLLLSIMVVLAIDKISLQISKKVDYIISLNYFLNYNYLIDKSKLIKLDNREWIIRVIGRWQDGILSRLHLKPVY